MKPARVLSLITLAGALIVFLAMDLPRRAKPLPKAILADGRSLQPGADNSTGIPDTPDADPTHARPVTAAMDVIEKELHPGDVFELCVRARIAGGHHIYGTNTMRGPFTPTTLTLSLPRALEAIDSWNAPEPMETKDGKLIYTEFVEFRRRVKIQPSAKPGQLMLSAELLCQACSEQLCWTPMKILLSVSVVVQNSKPESGGQ